jgi:phage-related protein
LGKPIRWVGSAKGDVSAFPRKAKAVIGYQLYLLENGQLPADARALIDVGNGAYEIRVQIGEDFRVIYVAKWEDAVYVLHAFHKKSRQIRQNDLELARKRYKEAKAASISSKVRP